ncbi:MAG: hypothetical protein ACRC9L_06270 [Brevinema sp.]
MPNFHELLHKYREEALSQRSKGNKFEALMQRYLLTDRKYNFTKVWLWGEFPYRGDFGGVDIGIDLVALDNQGAYWAIQCKFYEDSTPIQKAHVDTFLSASGKSFSTDIDPKTKFAHRVWISTSGNWSIHAEEALRNQEPAVISLNTSDLENSGVDWEKLDDGLYGKKALSEKKFLRDYQREAIEKAHHYFQTKDRGKLIMAC